MCLIKCPIPYHASGYYDSFPLLLLLLLRLLRTDNTLYNPLMLQTTGPRGHRQNTKPDLVLDYEDLGSHQSLFPDYQRVAPGGKGGAEWNGAPERRLFTSEGSRLRGPRPWLRC